MSVFDFLDASSLGDISDVDEFMKECEKYKSLKQSDIDNIPDEKLVTAVTSWVEGKFDEDWSNMGHVINEINTPAQNVYCCDYMLKEFFSGGFNQSFFNTSADFIGISAICFRTIGEINCAETIEYIVEEYKKRKETLPKSDVNSSLDMFLDSYQNNPLSDLDEKFKSVFNEKIYNEKIITYIRTKKQYFGD